MTPLHSAMSFLERMGQWTWSNSWQASVLVLLILAIGFLGRGWLTPRWRYALWMLVVARLLVPWVPSSTWSVFNLQRVVSGLRPVTLPADAPSATVSSSEIVPSSSDQGIVTVPRATNPVEDGAVVGWAQTCQRALQAVWLAGMGGFLTFALRRQRTLSRLLKHRSPVSRARVLRLLHRCQGELGLRRPIRVFELDAWPIPAVFGGLKPCLILPAGLAEELRDEELRLIFAHELVHVQRHDFLLNWLLIVIQAWHWFNPLVWLALKRIRAERELVCDARVLEPRDASARAQYGRTLIRLAQRASGLGFCPELIPVLNRPSELKRRIAMIVRPRRATWPGACVSMLFLLAAVALTFTTAAEQSGPKHILKRDAAEETRPTAQDDSSRSQASMERMVRVLQEELAKLRENIRKKEEDLVVLRMDLSHSQMEGGGQVPYAALSKAFQLLDQGRTQARAEDEPGDPLIPYLDHLGMEERRQVAFHLAPDPLLQSLMTQKFQTDQTLLELQASLSDKHPKVQSTLKLRDRINQQIEECLEGSLLGWQTKALAQRAAREQIEQAILQSRRRNQESQVQHHRYEEAKRELDNLARIEMALQGRLERARLQAQGQEENPDRPSVSF